MQAAMGRGPLCRRALRYACDFFDLDVFLVEEADVSCCSRARSAYANAWKSRTSTSRRTPQVQPLYASVVELFRAYFRHHAGKVFPPRTPGSTSADDEEADTSDDLLLVSGQP